MPSRVLRSKRVQVETGQMAVAPRVNDPRGFALRNQSGRKLTVRFEFDLGAHVQTAVIEEPRPTRRPGAVSFTANEQFM